MHGDDEALLKRYRPQLLYDSLEAYFADHPAQMLVNPGNEWRRADGTVVATAPFGLDALTPDGATSGDVLSIRNKDYAKQYARLRQAHPELNNHMVARVARDRNDRTWLQYWLWYFYNDYRLTAGYGLHEGDWEMVQLRLDADGAPDQVVYNQHRKAQARPWDRVEKDPKNPDTPIVYVARGSHASYFERGVHPTEIWADVCDGGRRGPEATLLVLDGTEAWPRWPGTWGDTKAHGPTDSNSPTGPGRKKEWGDPQKAWDDAYQQEPAKSPLPGPGFDVGRRHGLLTITYNVLRISGTPVTLAVNVNSAQEPGVPPKTAHFPVDGKKRGTLTTDVEVDPAKTYDVRLSMDIRTSDGQVLPSVVVKRTLDPGDHTPKRPFTTALGTFFVPLGEWVRRLFARRPGP